MKNFCAVVFGVALLLKFSPSTFGDEKTSAVASAPADEVAWKKLEASLEAIHEQSPPSLEPKEFGAFIAKMTDALAVQAEEYAAFLKQYPTSAHAEEAWQQWLECLSMAASRSSARLADLEKLEEKFLKDPQLTRSRRETIRRNQLDRIRTIEEREKFVRTVTKDFGDSDVFFCQEMLTTAHHSPYPHSLELTEEVLKLAEVKNMTYFRDEALALKKKLDRIGKPLSLKFKALDGSEIDLEKYRGKVVLLDFWATWCPPCVGGLPAVKALWEKRRADGFEVIGISYDRDKNTLESFLKKHPLGWPQFFDPQGIESELALALGKPGPPAYWLIDKEGLLVDINAKDKLNDKVDKLLKK